MVIDSNKAFDLSEKIFQARVEFDFLTSSECSYEKNRI